KAVFSIEVGVARFKSITLSCADRACASIIIYAGNDRPAACAFFHRRWATGSSPATTGSRDRLQTDPGRLRLFALLRGAVERLGDALERIGIGGLGAALRFGFHHRLGTAAQCGDQFRLVRRILDPGAVVLRVK